ncbi:MAG: polysaccharide deacetylase family protein [Candidatus Latescibacteria bacterium]|nr:polysaccharide deacetylase family protein [Candidatus Latescibacterota bacterium]
MNQRETIHSQSEGNPRALRVLMYHRIVDDADLCRAHWTSVHVRDFRRQLECLDRWGFTTITFDDYRLFLEGELNLPKKPVILTFDDGYLDTHQYAFPLLQEFGMKAVVFVLGKRAVKTNVWDRPLGLPEAPLMDWQHIMEMHVAGCEIGAHSMTHAKLSTLPERAAWSEIADSRTELEDLLNAPVLSFAYPYGVVDGRTKRMVEEAGYRIAYSVATGPATFGNDAYEVRRTTIFSTTGVIGFGLRVLTPFHYYEWLRWRTKRTFVHPNGTQDGNWLPGWEQQHQHPQPIETR